jgi:regulator of extracellular matrix RemA (YlzA/DUF370 family)
MMFSIGYEASVDEEKVLGIMPSNSSWAKRKIRRAEEEGTLFLATSGHRARSIVVTADEKVVVVWVSSLQSNTLAARFNKAKRDSKPEAED